MSVEWNRKLNPKDHWLASRGLPVIAGDIFFDPILTWIMDFFSFSPLNTSFYNWKHKKSLPENFNPECVEMRHGDVTLTLQWRHGLACGQRGTDVRLFDFYLSDRLVWVSHMGKNNENPDLVCQNA